MTSVSYADLQVRLQALTGRVARGKGRGTEVYVFALVLEKSSNVTRRCLVVVVSTGTTNPLLQDGEPSPIANSIAELFAMTRGVCGGGGGGRFIYLF